MGFYGDFLKAENNYSKRKSDERRIEIESQRSFEREMLNKKIDALNNLSTSLSNLSTSFINIQQPIVVCISIDKDTNPNDLKKLIEGLK